MTTAVTTAVTVAIAIAFVPLLFAPLYVAEWLMKRGRK